jgi:hypothetical protein
MKSLLHLLPFVVFSAACVPAPPASVQPNYLDEAPANFPIATGEAGPDDVGLFLAGKPVRYGAALSRLQQTLEYQEHVREMGGLWRATGRPRVERMKTWSNNHILPVTGGFHTMWYPFGGPDLLHATAMFPHARTYALMGLEPVGELPELETLPAGESLAALTAFRQATRTQLQAGYFITKDMREDLQRSSLRGVTPILVSTIAMTGGMVESVQKMSVAGNPAVAVAFRDAAGMRRTAYYVQGDLSNKGFSAGYRDWLTGLGRGFTYFKAASYLMHDSRFSQSRDFFLSQSRGILQDDSGIPFRHFKTGWNIRYFGSFEKLIDTFTKHHQEDLRAAFAANPKTPLNFGSGYHMKDEEANLIFATRR